MKRYLRNFISLAALALLLSVGTGAFAQSGAALIDQLETAFVDADSLNASVLSPESYQKARALQAEAAKKLAAKKAQKDVDELNLDALKQVQKSIESSKVAKLVLKDVLPARERALKVNAPAVAKREWEEAAAMWKKIVSQIEDNSLDAARKQQSEMIQRFGRAESEAIRNTLLKDARNAVEAAKKAYAPEYTPITYRGALEALNIAEADLKQNVYATDKTLQMARLATMEGKHALLLTEMARRFEKDKGGWEKGFLAYEEHLIGIARRLHLDLEWSDGADGAGTQLLQAIDSLRLAAESQKTLLDQKYSFLEQNYKSTRSRLETELSQAQLRVAELESKLGLAERESEIMKRQQQFEEKVKRLNANFSTNEASAKPLNKKDIVLRITGGSFPSGTATITKSMQQLLNKVVDGLQEFSNASFVVEGHTDATGDRETNQELSDKRAKAVADYLLSSLALPAGRMSAIGKGQDFPISDNQTREGRALNRRIDIIIKTQ